MPCSPLKGNRHNNRRFVSGTGSGCIGSSLRMHHFISWMFRDFHLVRAVLLDGSAKREVCDDVAALKTLVRLI